MQASTDRCAGGLTPRITKSNGVLHVGIRKCISSLGVLTAILLCTSAHAGDEAGAIVLDWHIYGGDVLFFDLTGTHNSSPCSFPERWAIDTQSPVGKAHNAAFLSAITGGKALQVIGSGTTCAHGNTEWVFTLRVIN